MEQQKPSVGRIVHYALKDRHGLIQARPAIIVRVWGEPVTMMSLVQLQVFTDGSNDGPEFASGVAWRTSVHYDADGSAGSWRWPPRT